MVDFQSDFSVPEPTGFAPCSICGRTFNPEVLSRHQRICSKAKQKATTRKPFDAAKHRMLGTEMEQFFASKPRGRANRPSTSEVKAAERKKKLDWRRKHEEFVETIRSARTITAALQSGAPLPPPLPAASNPDYVQCPHCNRRFQEYAAERHIPFCKEQSSRLDRKPAAKAQNSLNKRTQYKPPALRRRTSTTNDPNSPSKIPSAPGSSVVMRNTNFSATYTAGSPMSNRTRTTNVSGGGGGGVGGVKRSPQTVVTNGGRVSSESTPAGRPPIGGSTAMVRQTSFSKRAGQQQMAVVENGVEDTHLRNASSGGGTGTIVKSVASRRLYRVNEYSSDEGSNGSHSDIRGGIGRRRLLSRGRIAGSNGGSDRSSSPPNETEAQTRKGSGQRHLPPHPPSHPPPDFNNPSHPHPPRNNPSALPPDPFASRQISGVPPLSRDYSTDSMGRVGSGSSMGSHRGVHLNEHGMPLSKFCYECGTKFPVPQAKYCCECGTKRI